MVFYLILSKPNKDGRSKLGWDKSSGKIVFCASTKVIKIRIVEISLFLKKLDLHTSSVIRYAIAKLKGSREAVLLTKQ